MNNSLLNKLNDKQKEAVTTTEGPVLILAGAGSGKTTVLVNRIAYIIDKGLAQPYEILAITFTNKAAKELQSRIENILGIGGADVWASTFHSACIKILRKFIDYTGYDKAFNIFDRSDQTAVIKECIKELNLNSEQFQPKGILNEISRAKDRLISPTEYERRYSSDYYQGKVAKAYALYQKKLKECNAMDFDDIIVVTVNLLNNNSQILEYYQNKFKYISVDEYQDTNHAQYTLISLLADGHKNICVVGDDDQSIYKFRGADIGNILSFEQQYKSAKVIKLEQNYRSTQTILDAANNVIRNNKGRTGKSLWTESGEGTPITIFEAPNEYDEGHFIASRIKKLHTEDDIPYNNFALLYRTNAQSRVLEEMLIRNSVPYKILAGTRFYDRKEIKDIIAYLRCIFNPNDNVSLKRIINEPKRGIGKTTVDHVAQIADREDMSIYSIMCNMEDYEELKKLEGKLMPFLTLILELNMQMTQMPITDFIKEVCEKTGYNAILNGESKMDKLAKTENINELINVAAEYEKGAEEPDMAGFLESVALYSDIDDYDEDVDNVLLMTMHSAKGLEFPIVFLPGLEDGLFPNISAIDDYDELEEERRLCYVGITRAKKQLYITYAQLRTQYGRSTVSRPSRFVKEIPQQLINYEITAKNKVAIGDRDADASFTPANFGFKISVDSVKREGASYSVGDKVSHKKFGKGTIIDVKSVGSDQRLEIDFEGVGTKSLMAAYANLTKL
ncbi:MAG: DNA helicase PcrA [Eubacteriales bacterium]|nr:DNA helicase PcrA [Eubacteriales bacterium]